MYCPNCGAALPENSRFCGVCGAKIYEEENVTTGPQETGTNNVEISGEKRNGDTAVPPKRKINRTTIIGIITAVVFAAVAIFLVRFLISSVSSKNAYVCLSNGKYEVIKDLKDDPVEIESTRSSDFEENLVSFSPDGKYVYYLTEYDYSMDTGTLCRAKYGKLTDSSSKNEKYIEVISTNAYIGFRILDNGTVLYRKSDKTLYFYDGKTSTRIAKNADGFFTDGGEKTVYYSRDDYGKYTLYGSNVNDPEKVSKLASDISYTIDSDNLDSILYVKDDSYSERTLYTVGFDKDEEKLCENADVVYYGEDAKIYRSRTGTVRLYDYVIDEEPEKNSLLKKNLKDIENGFPIYTLYMYSNGKHTLISENVLSMMNVDGGVMYNTLDMVTDTVRMQDISDLSDVEALFKLDYGDENFLIHIGDTSPVKMSPKAAETYGNACVNGYAPLHVTDSSVFLKEPNGGLYVASFKKGTLSDFELLKDDAEVLMLVGNTLYYADNIYNNGSDTYCDAYAYKDGKSSRIAQDVFRYGIRVYDDNTVFAYTYRTNSEFEVTVFDAKGKKTVVGNNITEYWRADKNTVLFLSGGDLYSFDGKENKRIMNSVRWVWCKENMKFSRLNKTAG